MKMTVISCNFGLWSRPSPVHLLWTTTWSLPTSLDLDLEGSVIPILDSETDWYGNAWRSSGKLPLVLDFQTIFPSLHIHSRLLTTLHLISMTLWSALGVNRQLMLVFDFFLWLSIWTIGLCFMLALLNPILLDFRGLALMDLIHLGKLRPTRHLQPWHNTSPAPWTFSSWTFRPTNSLIRLCPTHVAQLHWRMLLSSMALDSSIPTWKKTHIEAYLRCSSILP